MSITKIYKGKLWQNGGGYDDTDSIYYGEYDILAEDIAVDIEEHGNFLTVKYFISDVELTKEELIKAHLLKVMGDAKAEWSICSSEATGYLWTDQELMVGGHDLIAELESHIGKYLYMEITYNKEAPE